MSPKRGRPSKRRLRGAAAGVANRPRWRMPAGRDGRGDRNHRRGRLVTILDEARLNDHAHVEVFALDALARVAAEAGDIATARNLCETADRRMEAATHFITDLDRTDAHTVRQIA